MTPAAVYLRQSLDKYGDGLAVARQRELCLGVCKANGWEPIEYVDNSISASDKRKDRPAYNRMVEDFEAGKFSAIVCYDLDRLTRQPRQLEDWIDAAEERGLRLVTADGQADLSTDNGRTYARVKLAFARGEVDRKGARQRFAAEQRAGLGKPWWPSRPFGFEMDGTHREDEAEALRQLYAKVLDGAAINAMTKWLNETGVPTPKGNAWHRGTLKPLLLNARNAGIRTYKGEEVGKAAWEPIVSEDLYRAAVRLLSSPDRRPKWGEGGFGKRSNLLTGIATCSKCGHTVRAAWRRTPAGERSYKVYQCGGCKGMTLPADWCDSLVVRKVIDKVEQWQDALPQAEAPKIDAAALRIEEKALASRIEELGEDYAEGLIPRSALRAGVAKAEARIAEIGQILESAAIEAHGFNIWDTELIWEWTGDESGKGYDLEKLTPIIKRVCKSITMTGPGKGNKMLSYGTHLAIEFNEP